LSGDLKPIACVTIHLPRLLPAGSVKSPHADFIAWHTDKEKVCYYCGITEAESQKINKKIRSKRYKRKIFGDRAFKTAWKISRK